LQFDALPTLAFQCLMDGLGCEVILLVIADFFIHFRDIIMDVFVFELLPKPQEMAFQVMYELIERIFYSFLILQDLIGVESLYFMELFDQVLILDDLA
jgi:hypothetical protein